MRESILLKTHIRGTQPLLMDALSLDSLRASKGARKGQDEEPEVVAERALYRGPDGRISVQNVAIMGSMKNVASDRNVPNKGKKTFKKFIQAGVRVYPEWIPVEPQDWIIDTRTGRNRSTGGMIIIHRPRFNNWELKFDIEIIDSEVVKPMNVRSILNDAGRFAGLLAFRPTFGLFEIVSMIQDGKEVPLGP
jgi:hypothetical protein